VTERKLTSKDGATVYSRTRYEYDEANQLTAVTDPLGNVTRYSYDANGNVTKVEDLALGQARTQTFDKVNRLTGMTAPGGTVAWTYDADDNVTRDDHGRQHHLYPQLRIQ